MIPTVLVLHVLGAITVGPIVALPFLVDAPQSVHRVLVLLRFSAGLTLVTGAALWVALHLQRPTWLLVSVGLFATVVVVIGAVLAPAAKQLAAGPAMRSRVRIAGILASTLVLCIAVLMVLRPGGG